MGTLDVREVTALTFRPLEAEVSGVSRDPTRDGALALQTMRMVLFL